MQDMTLLCTALIADAPWRMVRSIVELKAEFTTPSAPRLKAGIVMLETPKTPIHLMSRIAGEFLDRNLHTPDELVMVIPSHVAEEAVQSSGVCPVTIRGIAVMHRSDCPQGSVYIIERAVYDTSDWDFSDDDLA